LGRRVEGLNNRTEEEERWVDWNGRKRRKGRLGKEGKECVFPTETG
jgi:hypothetical protein